APVHGHGREHSGYRGACQNVSAKIAMLEGDGATGRQIRRDDRRGYHQLRVRCCQVPNEGYETTMAKDGHAAIQRLIAGFSPDVIVLDLEMPRVNGLEFLDWLKQDGVALPVVPSTILAES